jgi:hypothetical protein
MPEKPRLAPKVLIFQPRDYDRDQIEHARRVIRLARKLLAESDPSILLGRYWVTPPSEGQDDPPSESQ